MSFVGADIVSFVSSGDVRRAAAAAVAGATVPMIRAMRFRVGGGAHAAVGASAVTRGVGCSVRTLRVFRAGARVSRVRGSVRVAPTVARGGAWERTSLASDWAKRAPRGGGACTALAADG